MFKLIYFKPFRLLAGPHNLWYWLVILLGCLPLFPIPVAADTSLITQEIRYHMPEAGEVEFVWGINGWQTPPETMRPAGSRLKGSAVHTPMIHEGDTFMIRILVPVGTTLDYGFLVTKMRDGFPINLWQSNGGQDYRLEVQKNDIVEVEATVKPANQEATASYPHALAGQLTLMTLGLTAALGTVFVIKRSAPGDFKTVLQSQRLAYVMDLLRELVSRDMKLRYKRKVLGTVWSLLNPLAHFLVLNLVFTYVLPLRIPNYTAFLFTGVLVWSWFRASLYSATSSIVNNGMLIRRPGFPVAVLPVVTVTSHLIHFLLALPILLFFIYLGGIPITAAMLALPILIAVQFFLTLSLSYLVATIHVTFRDTQYLLDIFLLLGFYLSPVFYKASAIPAQYQAFYRLNPMVDLIDAYRLVLIEGRLPYPFPLLALAVLSAGLLWLGYTIFMRASYHFVEEL